MRIHTDNLNRNDLARAVDNIGANSGVVLHVQDTHNSRTHRIAFEVALRGTASRHTRRPNTGITGANSDEYAATHDDWGWFLAALYEHDHSMKAGPYHGRADFHVQTNNKYL